jgi:hypothetical protein
VAPESAGDVWTVEDFVGGRHSSKFRVEIETQIETANSKASLKVSQQFFKQTIFPTLSTNFYYFFRDKEKV